MDSQNTRHTTDKCPAGKCNNARHIEYFLDMLTAERGISSNTYAAYQHDLCHTAKFLHTQRVCLEDSLSRHIKSYIQYLFEKNMAAATVARRCATLRHFYRFLREEGHREDDPGAAIDLPRRGTRLPKVLSEKDITLLLQTAYSRPDTTKDAAYKNARLLCLLEILYAAGLRVSELVGLKKADVRAGDPVLKIKGKGQRQRMVPLTKQAMQAVQNYLDFESKERSPWLFPSRGKQKHLTRHRFAQLLKELAHEAGLPAHKVSPHVIRHAFASHLLHHGFDLRTLQQVLGHADISTTQIYTHVQTEKLQDLVQKHHPLSKVSK